MTRKEALEKIPHVRWYGDDAHSGWLIDTLIALGVLELDEPPDDITDLIREADWWTRTGGDVEFSPQGMSDAVDLIGRMKEALELSR